MKIKIIITKLIRIVVHCLPGRLRSASRRRAETTPPHEQLAHGGLVDHLIEFGKGQAPAVWLMLRDHLAVHARISSLHQAWPRPAAKDRLRNTLQMIEFRAGLCFSAWK